MTTNELAEAQREARDAADLVAALEERLRDGDTDITPEQLTAQRSVAEFASLRVEATGRRLAKARTADRLAALDVLRAEIEGYRDGDGDQLAKAANKVLATLGALTDLIRTRNERIEHWHSRMVALGVPAHSNPMVPLAEHGRLGHHGLQRVIAGRRRMVIIDPGPTVARVIAAFARQEAPLDLRMATGDPGDVAEWFTNIDVTPEPNLNLRFFLTTGGGIIEFDREPNEVERRGLQREISQKEAWGQ